MALVTKPRVVIHIGPMKTGTTALGVYFSDATAAGILPPNVVYPTGDLWFPAAGRITKHGQLFDYLVDRSENTVMRKTAIRDSGEVEAKVKAAAEFASTLDVRDPTVVFINETLTRRRNTEELITMMGRYFSSVTLVLAVRSPIEAASSFLVHRIKDWRVPQYDLDLVAMLNGADEDSGESQAHSLERWTSNSNVTTALIPIFENEVDGYASVDRFFGVVTGEPAPRLDDDFGSRRIHPSLPLKSLKRLIRLKKLNRSMGAIPILSGVVNRLFMRTLLVDRHKVVHAGFSDRNTDGAYWQVSDVERKAILEMFAPFFAALRTALGKKSLSAEWRLWFEEAQR